MTNILPESRLFYALLLLLYLPVQTISDHSGSPLAPALFVFGDSLFDNGNNNFLPTVARANYLPYGNKFSKGATGRFTNGRTVVDFIAEFLGLPYPPPYMSLNQPDVITGLNFASGACGILPETGSRYGVCLDLNNQVTLFERTVRSLREHFNNSKDFSDYLSKSIFTFSIGSNDYLSNYLDPSRFNTSRQYSPEIFSQILIGNLSRHLTRLYDMGVRKFVAFEIGPIGCIPSITRRWNHTGMCVKEPNGLVSLFNNNLQETLMNMTLKLKSSTFVLGQANWLGVDAILNPSRYGFADSRNPCCKTLRISVCIPLLSSCSQPEKHFFWDGFHETEAFYSLVATRCFNATSVCTPLNIKELVQI